MNYTKGDYVIYRNGEKYEIGRIASIRHDGAFVCYHEGETASKTSYDRMHKLINACVIKRTTLGGGRFDEEQPERLSDDDIETIRIHLSAFKERLCNQHRWEEVQDYQDLIERVMALRKERM